MQEYFPHLLAFVGFGGLITIAILIYRTGATVTELKKDIEHAKELNTVQNGSIISDIRELKAKIEDVEKRKVSTETFRAVRQPSKPDT